LILNDWLIQFDQRIWAPSSGYNPMVAETIEWEGDAFLYIGVKNIRKDVKEPGKGGSSRKIGNISGSITCFQPWFYYCLKFLLGNKIFVASMAD
jgi:hypothetical protein